MEGSDSQRSTPNERRPKEPEGGAAEQAKDQAKRAYGFVMRFELPERLMLVGSGAALLLGFLPWWSMSHPQMSTSANAFAPWHGTIFLLTSLATVLLLAVPAIREPLLGGQPPARRRLIFFGLCLATLLFGPLLFGLSTQTNAQFPEFMSASISFGKTAWYWLALIASGAAVAGGWMQLQRKDEDPVEAS